MVICLKMNISCVFGNKMREFLKTTKQITKNFPKHRGWERKQSSVGLSLMFVYGCSVSLFSLPIPMYDVKFHGWLCIKHKENKL